jgi:hypothetical protein
MAVDLASHLLYQEIRDRIRKCDWCHKPLPNERYHLRICPKCRRGTLQDAQGGEHYNPFPPGQVIVDREGKKWQIMYMSQDK